MRNFWTMAVAAGLVAALGVYTICFTVREGTVGVVYRLGKIDRAIDQPGLRFKYPWPFEAAQEVDNRVRVLRVEGKETSTGDAENNVLITISVGWRIRPGQVADFLSRVVSAENAELMLQNRVADARQNVIQRIRLNDIVSSDAAQGERYAKFEDDLRDELQRGLDADKARFGIEIAFLKVPAIKFPTKVTEKVNDRMIKERERISKDLIAQGNNNAELIRNQAKLYRDEMLKKAEGEAIRIRGEGDAAAAEYYKVFKENPDLAGWLRRLDATGEIFGKHSTFVLPPDNPLEYLLQGVPSEESLGKGMNEKGK